MSCLLFLRLYIFSLLRFLINCSFLFFKNSFPHPSCHRGESRYVVTCRDTVLCPKWRQEKPVDKKRPAFVHHELHLSRNSYRSIIQLRTLSLLEYLCCNDQNDEDTPFRRASKERHANMMVANREVIWKMAGNLRSRSSDLSTCPESLVNWLFMMKKVYTIEINVSKNPSRFSLLLQDLDKICPIKIPATIKFSYVPEFLM